MKVASQKGFGGIEVLLFLIVVSIVGFGGYYVWNTQQDKNTKSNNSGASISNSSQDNASSTGGPAPGQIVTKSIKLVTGQYIPAHIDIKKGETVMWVISDLPGETPRKHAIENDTSSLEKFSSIDLKTDDKFSHTFNQAGIFSWHDKYNGDLTGSVTVTE